MKRTYINTLWVSAQSVGGLDAHGQDKREALRGRIETASGRTWTKEGVCVSFAKRVVQHVLVHNLTVGVAPAVEQLHLCSRHTHSRSGMIAPRHSHPDRLPPCVFRHGRDLCPQLTEFHSGCSLTITTFVASTIQTAYRATSSCQSMTEPGFIQSVS